MLRVTQSTSAAAAKQYFTENLARQDYYSAGQTVTGHWHGQAAERLGLVGEVTSKHFFALADNHHPRTGEQLTPRQKHNRTPGYDFTFSAPKSVSLLYGLTGDPRIKTAMETAVAETMREIEGEMQTRVRKGGVFADRTTGNMAWASFTHELARPVEGVPDPQLHVHAYAFNVTWDREEQSWKAGQFREAKRQAGYYEAVFHSRLAAAMRDMGFDIRREGKWWNLAEISPETVHMFSRRTEQVEQAAARLGITDPDAKGELGKRTREGKEGDVATENMRAQWWDRMTPKARREVLAAIATLSGGGNNPASGETRQRTLEEQEQDVQAALAYAVAHTFERDSAVHEKELLAEALRHGAGRIFAEQVRRAVRRGEHGILSRTIEGQPMVTTREVLAEEKAMLAWAARTKQPQRCVQPLGRPGQGHFRSDWLNEGQQAAVRYVLESRHRLMMIRGGAGKGKSTLMQAAAKEIEAQSGTQIFAFAPGTKARDVLRKEGFKDAQTVAHLFHNDVLQHRLRGNVLWIDEAGQMGVQDMNKVFALAEAMGCRLLLSGDAGQHGSIPRGDAMRLLQDKAGIQGPVLTEILRQQGAYKEAVAAIEHGRIEEGFRSFDALGWVVEAPEEVRHTLIAQDYAWYTRAGDTVLAVAPTHAEGRRVTAAIRAELRKEGRLGQAEHAIVSLRNLQWTEAEKSQAASYRPGMIVQFVQNAKGITNGARFEVVQAGDGRVMLSGLGEDGTPRLLPLPFDKPKRFHVYDPVPLALAEGDAVRITQKSKSEEGRTLENGTFYTVAGFRTDHAGRLTGIRLSNGAVIPPGFGHVTHGYYTTSHGSQGETADRLLLAEGAESLPAASREQFYVSVSRGRTSAKIYTDDKEALLERIHNTSHRLSATELMAGEGTPWGKPWADTWDMNAHRNNRKRRMDKRRRQAEQERESRREPETIKLIERAHEGKVTRGSGMEI